MDRRAFLFSSAAAPAAGFNRAGDGIPKYRIVTSYKHEPHYELPGQVVRVHAANSINENTGEADPAVVREMMSRGLTSLTGDKDPRDAWRRFVQPSDVVGVKVNASGAPKIMSHPVVVAEIVRNLLDVGVKPTSITLYERFPDQLASIHYDRYLPARVNIHAVEPYRNRLTEYDLKTYVETDFFGEEETRSYMIRMVSERFTKIINVPNMKDHGASGVTGCLKNMAYGDFSNVARSHAYNKTHTKTFIGTLASVEPLRSRVVLHVMDGLKSIWHGGPFQRDPRFAFFPKQMMFGTDPVSVDRIMRDVIEAKRKAEGAVSVFNRDVEITKNVRPLDPNKNIYIREPLHIEYAGSLGLGVADIEKIHLKEITL
ncbi:MAG: hypothetical protein IANPNBLG_00625 [Bryobacteraceae bacterium]|nr:hypothetical protein [Bryobacteraceae bacterium]MCC6344205.1 DUF362 domain-containing protein [Bryobacterales bacterium]